MSERCNLTLVTVVDGAGSGDQGDLSCGQEGKLHGEDTTFRNVLCLGGVCTCLA